MSSYSWILYGANGYTGRLIAREAVRRGLRPVLAGRSKEAIERLAAELGLEARVLALDDPERLRRALGEARAVLHCAGPFTRTSRPMVEACLLAGVHYLDITGEIAVLERIYAHHLDAESAGTVLLPAVGFDVVPTDCLADRLARSLPDADSLELAFFTRRGSASPGTLKTLVEGFPRAGAIRRDGKLVPVPIAFEAKEIPFSCGTRWTMSIPWGDLSSAYRSTGIPNIRVYTGAPRRRIGRLRRLAPVLPLLGTRPVRRALQWWIGRAVPGPGPEERRQARTYLWGRVRRADGESRTATLETPEGYSFTATSAVECLTRVLAGAVPPGAWTPSQAFGPGFAGELPGVIEGEVRPGPPSQALHLEAATAPGDRHR
ncbi:MAG: saccharopine dehydrogenase NADP-binding domain-containing protein [Thermoanaerobaculia bacterium]